MIHDADSRMCRQNAAHIRIYEFCENEPAP